MSKIDVQSIYEKIFEPLEKDFKEELLGLLANITEADEANVNIGKTMVALVTALQNHSERFTVALVQKVVDEFEKSINT